MKTVAQENPKKENETCLQKYFEFTQKSISKKNNKYSRTNLSIKKVTKKDNRQR